MATARKAAVESMGKVDLVIEVLDARVPYASRNPMFEAMRLQSQRPALKLLNKSDAADPEATRNWLQHYNAQSGVKAVPLCAKKPADVKRIPQICRSMVPGRGTAPKPLRLMILGIPNVGKSTLMNALLKRRVAAVGDEPAVTKNQMFHELSPEMNLLDTPGMLWPGMTQYVSYKLAATHSIGRAAYEDEDVAMHLGDYLLKHYRPLLEQRFGNLPSNCDGHGLLASVAAARRLSKTAGQPDLGRAATTLINEFRGGTLGRISLETVQEVAALEAM
jgi:ribosome biogenesis GTPase A